MKTINVSFEDAEFEAIEKAKGMQSWRDYIINSAKARVLELYDDRDVPIISRVLDVANNFQFTFDMPVQMDLKAIVVKVPEEEEKERGKEK